MMKTVRKFLAFSAVLFAAVSAVCLTACKDNGLTDPQEWVSSIRLLNTKESYYQTAVANSEDFENAGDGPALWEVSSVDGGKIMPTVLHEDTNLGNNGSDGYAKFTLPDSSNNMRGVWMHTRNSIRVNKNDTVVVDFYAHGKCTVAAAYSYDGIHFNDLSFPKPPEGLLKPLTEEYVNYRVGLPDMPAGYAYFGIYIVPDKTVEVAETYAFFDDINCEILSQCYAFKAGSYMELKSEVISKRETTMSDKTVEYEIVADNTSAKDAAIINGSTLTANSVGSVAVRPKVIDYNGEYFYGDTFYVNVRNAD